MAAVLDEAASLIRRRLQELDTEKDRLENALRELGGSPAKPVSKSSGGTKRKRRRKRGKRSGPGRKEQVLEQIKANPSIKTGEVAKNIGIGNTQVSNLLTKLKKAGALKGGSGKWTVSES